MSEDYDIPSVIQRYVTQEHRLTNVEGRVTALETSTLRIEQISDGILKTVNRGVAWALGTCIVFILGLLGVVIELAMKHG